MRDFLIEEKAKRKIERNKKQNKIQKRLHLEKHQYDLIPCGIWHSKCLIGQINGTLLRFCLQAFVDLQWILTQKHQIHVHYTIIDFGNFIM